MTKDPDDISGAFERPEDGKYWEEYRKGTLFESEDPATPGMRIVDAIKDYSSGQEETTIINPVTTDNEPIYFGSTPTYSFPNVEQPQAMENGTKHDQEKPRMELLDAEWLEDVARVMTFGAKKYADHNWRSGLRVSRLIGAALRHLMAILRGEDIDKETNLSHASHLSCCAMFLFWTLTHRKDLDDRWGAR